MKAIIELDVPKWQIGQAVTVFFPNTMMLCGICRDDKIVMCKDCKHSKRYGENEKNYLYGCEFGNGLRESDWFCADGVHR